MPLPQPTAARSPRASPPPRVASAEAVRTSTALDLHLPADCARDDDWLLALCEANRDLRIERSSQGNLIIMRPTGAETGARNADLTRHVGNWATEDGQGRVFDSSTGFLLPNGAMRAPGLAWVRKARLAALSASQKRHFLPLAPDVIVELASPSDNPTALHAKMREWRDNGVRLGWLLLPEQRQVWQYEPGSEPVCLHDPTELRDAERLPGLALPLAAIWEAGL